MRNLPNEDDRLSVREAADEIGVSEKTVRSLIRRGDLVAFKISERKTYVLREDLGAFLESRRTSPALAGRR